MKKRMLAMVFACFMAMSLTACGGSNNAASSTTESTTQAQTDTSPKGAKLRGIQFS